MKALSKKIMTIALSVGSCACLLFGGVFALSKDTAKADAAVSQISDTIVETAVFKGAWGNLDIYNSATQVLLQYSSTTAWDHTNKGNLTSKITFKNSKTGATQAAADGNIAGWEGQKWIVLKNFSDIDVIEIAEGAVFGGGIEIPALTLYLINGRWVTTAPQAPTTRYLRVATGWNNAISEAKGQTIFRFDITLGDAANATNLASTINATSMMVKYNGKTFVELYKDTTNANHLGYIISYAHSNNCFYFTIPEADLVEGAILEIENGTPFMNEYLAATKFKLVGGQWQQMVNYQPDFWSIGAANQLENGNHWGLSLTYNTLGFTQPDAQVMAAGYTGITLNGEAAHPALWGGDQLLFWLSKDKCVAGYNGYKYPTLVIEDGATVTNDNGETFTLGGVTLYLVNGLWTTEYPVLPATSFVEVETLYGWNNNIAGGIAHTLLEFGNTLGAANDATNQAANTSFDAATKIKLNGKSVNEWYLEDGQTAVDYQHGNAYMQIKIPESYLQLSSAEYPYPTLTIEDGTEFCNYSLPAVTLYCVNGYWITQKPAMQATTKYSAIAGGWNNTISEEKGQTILRFDVNPLGNGNNATNLAATVNATSLMVKYNDKTFYELYKDTTNANRTKYTISYAHGNGYFYFTIPEADLVEGAILEIENGTPFMNEYLAAVKFKLVSGQWQEVIEINYEPDFVSIGSLNHSANATLQSYGLSLVYDTLGFTTAGNQVTATSFTDITLNGDAIRPAFWGGEQLLFWLPMDKCVAGYNGYKYPTLVIEDGATVTNANGETFTLGGVTLYLVNGAWTTEYPTLPATSFVEVETAFGWNNTIAGGIAHTLLEFSNTLGAANDLTNQAADTSFDVATKIKLNGKSVNEWYLEDGQTAVDYQHGGKYLQIKIPASYLELSSAEYPCLTLTIEEGAEFMNYSLPAVTLYCVNNYWVMQQPAESATTNYDGIADGWNNRVTNGVSDTVLRFDVNPLGDAANATNLASTTNVTSVKVKYNGKNFSALYNDGTNANHSKYSISYAHGNGFFHFAIPEADLVEGATLEIEEGTPFMNEYLSAVTLYFVDGAWTTDITNYNPDYVRIGTFNHYDNNTSWGLSLVYDTTGFTTAGAQIMAAGYTGITLNGEACHPALWGGEQLLFWMSKDKCVEGYNGYTHATLIIEEGATVTNENGKTFTLGGATFYLMDGMWTTTQPDGYEIRASFTDFNVKNVGTHNHYYDANAGYYRLTLDFNQGGLAFNQYPTAISGITYNGVNMTIGGSPSNDKIVLVTLDNGLWIWYSEDQAKAGFKFYTHPTIHFENGATVKDANGVTISYAEATFYLVDGVWTTTQPDGWGIEKKLMNPEIKWNNIDYAKYDEKYGLSGGALILIGYHERISDYSNSPTNETNLITADSSVGNNIKVSGVALKDIEGAYALLHEGYLYLYVPVCKEVTIEAGTMVYDYVLPETTFYFADKWTMEEPTYTAVEFQSVHWNNYDYNGYGSKYGQESSLGTPANGFCALFAYSANLGTAAIEANMATAYLDIGTKLKVNGVSAKDIEGAYISYNVAQHYLYFYVPFSGLTKSDVYVVTIEDGAKFLNAALEGTTHYFYDGQFHDNAPIIVTIEYGEISVSKRFSGSQEITTEYLANALSRSAVSVCPLVWTVDGVEYFAGETLTVSETTTLSVVEAVEFETMYGASVRITNDGNYGIRFESRIELEAFNALIAKYGEENIKTGTYIVPKALFDKAGMSIAEYFAQEQGEGANSKYVNVSNFNAENSRNGIYNRDTYQTDGYIQYYGALTNLNGSNYYTQFFGVGYITITIGDKTATVYGLSNVAKTTRTIYDVASMAYSDMEEEYSDDEMIVLEQYLDSVAMFTYSNGNLFADTKVTGREYESAYTITFDGSTYLVTSSVCPKAVVINGKKVAFELDEADGVYMFELSAEDVDSVFGSSLKYGIGEPNYDVWGAGSESATDDMLAGIAGELGVTSYRVWVNNTMGSVGVGNVVTLGTTHVEALKSHVRALVEDGGVNEILFANGAFIMPYTYPCYYVADKNGNELWVSYEQLLGGGYTRITHDISIVPDPTNEPEAYKVWLKVQYDYFVLFAAEVKAWKTEFGWTDNVVKFYFEGINEPEFQNLIHKRGTYENGERTMDYYTASELAKILTDVSYYMTLAVEGVGEVTTPALTNISSNSGGSTNTQVYCDTLLAALYDQINDDVAPTAIAGIMPANTKDENDYFTCLNWHPYLPWFKAEHSEMYYGEIVTEKTWWGSSKEVAKVNSSYASMWVSWNNAMYQIAVRGGDEDAPKVFFSEFGLCDWGTPQSGQYQKMGIGEELAATVFKTLLNNANSLTFADELTVIAFRAFDVEELGSGEGNFGFIDEDGQIKEIMKEYFIIINGHDDTASLQLKIDEYFG